MSRNGSRRRGGRTPVLAVNRPLAESTREVVDFYGSNTEAARVLGVSESTVSDLLSGRTGHTTATIGKVEEALRVIRVLKRNNIGPGAINIVGDRARPPGIRTLEGLTAEHPPVVLHREVAAGERFVQAEESPVHLSQAPLPPEIVRDEESGAVARVYGPAQRQPVERERTCDVCERTLPLDPEHFYYKAKADTSSYERTCRRCSLRLRGRVEKALRKERKSRPTNADIAYREGAVLLRGVAEALLDLASQVEETAGAFAALGGHERG